MGMGLLARPGLTMPEAAADMAGWDDGGSPSTTSRSSGQASPCTPGSTARPRDRKGLESQGQGVALSGASRMERLALAGE